VSELEADTNQLDTLRHTAQLFTQLQVRITRENGAMLPLAAMESRIRKLEADTNQEDTLHTVKLYFQLKVRTTRLKCKGGSPGVLCPGDISEQQRARHSQAQCQAISHLQARIIKGIGTNVFVFLWIVNNLFQVLILPVK